MGLRFADGETLDRFVPPTYDSVQPDAADLIDDWKSLNEAFDRIIAAHESGNLATEPVAELVELPSNVVRLDD